MIIEEIIKIIRVRIDVDQLTLVTGNHDQGQFETTGCLYDLIDFDVTNNTLSARLEDLWTNWYVNWWAELTIMELDRIHPFRRVSYMGYFGKAHYAHSNVTGEVFKVEFLEDATSVVNLGEA
jgi:hypothetical protein